MAKKNILSQKKIGKLITKDLEVKRLKKTNGKSKKNISGKKHNFNKFIN